MRLTRVLAGVLAAGMLTACGGGDDGDGKGAGGGKKVKGVPVEEEAAPPATTLAVPALYDTSRGWESDLRGTQLPLPHSDAVAVFSSEERRFTVLDVAGGETLWTSAALEPPGEDMRYEPLSTTVGGKDYLVAWTSGTTNGDVVTQGSEVTTIDVFGAEGSGTAVKPLRRVELDGEGVVVNGGGGLMVKQEDGDVIVSVDPVTGATEKYDLFEMEPPSGVCKLCGPRSEVLGITAAGPLVTMESGTRRGFWVPGAWSSADVTDDGGPFPSLVREDVLVAMWREDGAAEETWAALDSATGEVRAEVPCRPERGINDDDAEGTMLSGSGRYLVRGHVVFDMEQGTGHCFERTERDKPVQLNGVSDSGVAFGLAPPQGDYADDTPVVVDIATGEVEESKHRVVPFADYAGHGLFWDDETSTMVVYPHAS